MTTNQEVLLALKGQLDGCRKQIENNNKVASSDYMRFFTFYADLNYKLTYMMLQLLVFFPEGEEEMDESQVRGYLQTGIDDFTVALLQRPLQRNSTNAMVNLGHGLELEAMQDLLKLYKYMLSKYEK